MNTYANAIAMAKKWREQNDYQGGVVIVFGNEVCGWCNQLRNPESWQPGCIAVDERGNCCEAIGGNSYDGALRWIPVDIDAKRTEAATEAAGRWVKNDGGNRVAQQIARIYAKSIIKTGGSAASAIQSGYRAAMRIDENQLLKQQAI